MEFLDWLILVLKGLFVLIFLSIVFGMVQNTAQLIISYYFEVRRQFLVDLGAEEKEISEPRKDVH